MRHTPGRFVRTAGTARQSGPESLGDAVGSSCGCAFLQSQCAHGCCGASPIKAVVDKLEKRAPMLLLRALALLLAVGPASSRRGRKKAHSITVEQLEKLEHLEIDAMGRVMMPTPLSDAGGEPVARPTLKTTRAGAGMLPGLGAPLHKVTHPPPSCPCAPPSPPSSPWAAVRLQNTDRAALAQMGHVGVFDEEGMRVVMAWPGRVAVKFDPPQRSSPPSPTHSHMHAGAHSLAHNWPRTRSCGLLLKTTTATCYSSGQVQILPGHGQDLGHDCC